MGKRSVGIGRQLRLVKSEGEETMKNLLINVLEMLTVFIEHMFFSLISPEKIEYLQLN